MLPEIWHASAHAVMITAFVAAMMIVVEYVNVLTRGTFRTVLRGSRRLQYLGAVLLGLLPGCLGAFAVVALYTHRVVSFGALVGAMIATSGDEAFVMLAVFPRTALWLMAGLGALGLVVGPVVDRLRDDSEAGEACPEMVIHEEACECFPGRAILTQWRSPAGSRIVLTGGMILYTLWIVSGLGGLPEEWGWIRITLLLVGPLGIFIVATVPDHFLRDHLWGHVALRHVPRIFAWTLGVLVVVAVAGHFVDLSRVVGDNRWWVLAGAAAVGLVPESGPHLLFVTLHASGALPVSILAASSIVQDGHGMLPLLAESRGDFIRVKAVNLLVGLLVGAILLLLGH